MLEHIFRYFRKTTRNGYQLPPGRRVYAVGDIHGRVDLLGRLQRLIYRDASEHGGVCHQVVYLGDYLDRGPYVKETVEALIVASNSLEHCCLMGNHEQLFLKFLEDPALLEPWLGLGGQSTLMSYGVRAPGSGFSVQRAVQVRDALQAAVPSRHLEFLNNLKPFLKLGDYLFVHAGIRPDVPLEAQTSEDLFWTRSGGGAGGNGHGYRIVHGHTIREQPRVSENSIGVDTGAYATGILTCAVLQDGQVEFLSTEAGT